MRIGVWSDLHLEFGGPIPLMTKDIDVAVIAGDIAQAKTFGKQCDRLGRYFKNSDVVIVPGNHDYWGGEMTLPRRANVHVLSNARWGRFVGSTMWYPPEPRPELRSHMNDFRYLKFDPTLRHEECRNYLLETLNPGDILVTHMLPTPEAVHPRYAVDALNQYFVSDIREVIEATRPAIACFGHTHESYRKGIYVCNPYGYWGHRVNPNFDPNLVITSTQ